MGRGLPNSDGPSWGGIRGTRHQRGYGYSWVKLREEILKRDLNVCQPCLRLGRDEPATQVDHIVNKAAGGTDAPDNLQSICAACHEAKSRQERFKGKYGERRPRIGIEGWNVPR
jgi:5-methylcytosine-specific restriction enzyme A